MRKCKYCKEPNIRPRSEFCSKSCIGKFSYSTKRGLDLVKRCSMPACTTDFVGSGSYCRPCRNEYEKTKRKTSLRQMHDDILELKAMVKELMK